MSRNSPYQDLFPFAEEDADYFFGRESEIRLLADNLLASRLTVVYGESGAGKSSLLRAGVARQINDEARQQHKRFGDAEFCAVVFRDWKIEPVAGILEAAVKSLTFVQEKESDEWRCLGCNIEQGLAACRGHFGFQGDLLIILDQFEDLLEYHPEAGGKDGFGDQFTGLLDEPDARLHFLLAVREDALATLDFFKARIPRLLDNRLRIEHLSRVAAVQAILKPLGSWKEAYGAEAGPVEMESSSTAEEQRIADAQRIADEVVKEIMAAQERRPGAGGQRVQASLLQLVMTRWWEREREQKSPQMRPATLRKELGGFANVVKKHFTEKVEGLDAWEQELAYAIFDKMVTITGRKQAQTVAELAVEEPRRAPTQALLDRLYEARIVATVTPPRGSGSQERCYEFAHDVLAQAALNWRRERARTEAEEKAREEQRRIERERIAEEKKAEEERQLVERARIAAEMAAKEKRVAARLRRYVWRLGFALGIAVLAVGVALWQFWRADREAELALGLQLAAQSEVVFRSDPAGLEEATLLAVESMRRVSLFENDLLLRRRLALLPRQVSQARIEDAVSAVAFSSDGRWVATGSRDKTARVFEAATGKQVASLPHQDSVCAVAFSPDGRWVATGSWDKTARVFEVATRKEVFSLQHQHSVCAVAFSPDGRWVATGSRDKMARVFEATTGKEVSRLEHQDTVSAVAFSPDGRRVATGSGDKTARVFEAATGKQVYRLAHQDAVYAVAFSPDGRWVATGSKDKTARVFEVAAGREVSRLVREDFVYAVAFSTDGRWWVATGSGDKTARVIEAATGKEVSRLTHEDSVSAVAFSPDGRRVATGSKDKTARVFEVATRKDVSRLEHQDTVSAVAISPDGRRVATATGGGDQARVFEVATGKEAFHFEHQDTVNAVAFSPDGRRVATGSWDKTARVFEVATRKEVSRLEHQDIVSAVAFSPDGRWVATGSRDKVARVFEVATRKEVSRLAHDDTVNAVAFSPDGRRVATATGSGDKTARVFEAATGKEVSRLAHEDTVYAVAFSPDGRWVATGSGDKTARVFEAATGHERSRLELDNEVAITLRFSPDGGQLLTVSKAASGSDLVLLRHDLRPEDLTREACSRLTRNLTTGESSRYFPGESRRRTCPKLP